MAVKYVIYHIFVIFALHHSLLVIKLLSLFKSVLFLVIDNFDVINVFTCPQCFKVYSHQTSRTRHIKYGCEKLKHTEKKKFVCTSVGCDYAAKRKDYLRRHMIRKHGEILGSRRAKYPSTSQPKKISEGRKKKKIEKSATTD